MNILTEEVAIEGRNIIKDFQLGDTKTRVLKKHIAESDTG